MDVRLVIVVPVTSSQYSRKIVPVPPLPSGTKLARAVVLPRMRIVMGLDVPPISPLQPAKSKPAAAVAVRVTEVPPGNVVPVGLRLTVPEPFTVVVRV